MSPTSRTLNKLRSEGWLPGIVEKFNSFTKTRFDLYGFVDVVAIRDNETIAIQSTSYSNVPSRVNKIKEHINYPIVKKAWRIEVWGWQKKKRISKQGKIYYRYEARIVEL
jgi:hypothetical protein